MTPAAEIHHPVHESIGLLKSQAIETVMGNLHCGNTLFPNMRLRLFMVWLRGFSTERAVADMGRGQSLLPQNLDFSFLLMS